MFKVYMLLDAIGKPHLRCFYFRKTCQSLMLEQNIANLHNLNGAHRKFTKAAA